jgi:hypothetical protein
VSDTSVGVGCWGYIMVICGDELVFDSVGVGNVFFCIVLLFFI